MRYGSSHGLPRSDSGTPIRGLKQMKLIQKTVAALELPKGKSEAIFFDDDLPGFGLRIRVGGARTWVYQFKIGERNRRLTLGSAAAVTPARALKAPTRSTRRSVWDGIQAQRKSKDVLEPPRLWPPP
jgi:Arm DNA-binding domain